MGRLDVAAWGVGLLLVPTITTAQFCFRGRPAPTCDSYLVTEFALAHRLSTPVGEPPWLFTGHVAVTYGDWFGAGMQIETLPRSTRRTLIGPRVQLASYPAGFVGAIVAIIGVPFVASATST